MSSRNRARGASNQDADEERRLWKEIKDKAKDLDVMKARSDAIGNEIIQIEAEQAALIDSGKPASASLDERLEKLYRENVKICEEYQQSVDGQSNGMNLLDSIKVLAGLREASEESAAALQISGGSQRAASGKLNRPKKSAGLKGGSAVTTAVPTDEAGDGEVSAAPSPRISLSAAGRFKSKDGSSRAGSVSATREASVKIEDGAESVASSTDAPSTANGPSAKGSSAASRTSNRLVLRMGEVVFCRHDQRNAKPGELEGEGILCRVTNVIGEGKQRRYEVQDADITESTPAPQRASVSQLMQIPETNRGLPDLPKTKSVLAQYPDTTTFYKAEVSEHWKGSKSSEVELGMVRLQFQDDAQVMEVERRFVLTEK